MMHFQQDITRSLSSTIGAHGISDAAFAETLAKTVPIVADLRTQISSKRSPLLTIAYRNDDLAAIESCAASLREHFTTLVVVGMGGSSLSGKTLAALAKSEFGYLGDPIALHFMDNIDPVSLDDLITHADLSTTAFLVVSKSGGTMETLAHFLILWEAVTQRVGAEQAAQHFIIVTEPQTSVLRRLATERKMTILNHDPIGGRFSCLTVVGLLPAAVAGLDIRAIRRGAASVLDQLMTSDACESARGAALHYALALQGKTVSVMMPYCDRLEMLSAWCRQVWAESLGKDGKGTLMIRALGATDQHSQLQLYIDGPRDKAFTLLFLDQHHQGAVIPSIPDPELQHLGGKTIGDLMQAEQYGTADSLTRNHCPLRILTMSRLTEETLGALMMHFMLETIIMAGLLGVDPFNQPAVEESKELARAFLAKGRTQG